MRSMTGFGQAAQSCNGVQIQVSLKSVNHRYSEIIVRIPREWMKLEESIKKMLQKEIRRGRVEVFISLDSTIPRSSSIQINWSIVEGYYKAAVQISERLNIKSDFQIQELLKLPDAVLFIEDEIDQDQLEAAILTAVQEALDRYIQMRQSEGTALMQDLQERIDILETSLVQISTLAPAVAMDYRTKLHHRIQEVTTDIMALDENRLLLEIALFADRANIDEEITRLKSHFQQCREAFQVEEPIGRRLDFLIQEMNREVNTIGSKSNHLEITQHVVNMKAEIEKMREQIQNLE